MGVARRALQAHADPPLALQPLAQGKHEARLADARLAREHHDLAVARACQARAIDQERQLLLAADQLDDALRMERLEAAIRRDLADDRPAVHALANPFIDRAPRSTRSNRLPMRRRVVAAITTWPGPARLEPRGEIRRLADHRSFSRRPVGKIAHHDEAGGDADAAGERLA